MTQDSGMWKKGAQFVRVLPLPLRKKRTMSLAFSLAVKIREVEGQQFVSTCPTLRVITYGESREEAYENIEDAVGLVLKNYIDAGTLDKILVACGMTKIDEKRQISKNVVQTQIIKSTTFSPRFENRTEKKKAKEKVTEARETTMVHATA